MKKFTWLIPLLFCLNVVFAGCDERGRQPGTRTTPTRTIQRVSVQNTEEEPDTREDIQAPRNTQRRVEHKNNVVSF
jgi:hypothetical protein